MHIQRKPVVPEAYWITLLAIATVVIVGLGVLLIGCK